MTDLVHEGLLDQTYNRLRDTGPEFQGWLSNHGPIVLRWLLDPRHPGEAVDVALHVRDQQLTNRSHALLRAAAALDDVLASSNPPVGPDNPHADVP